MDKNFFGISFTSSACEADADSQSFVELVETELCVIGGGIGDTVLK